MNKSSLEKLLKTDAHYSTDLVSLDFKSESLNKFLQNVVNIVNQHSNKINSLQMNKITIDEVRQANIQLFNACKLPPNIAQELPVVNIPPRQDSFEQSVESLSSHLTMHSHGFQYLLDLIKTQNNKIANLSDSLGTFETIDNTKQMFRKAQQIGKKFTEDQASKLSTRLKDLQMNTKKKLNQFQNLTKQVEKKTLWKITQCEQSLMKKITPQYVQKALQQQENQIIFKIQQNKNAQMGELKYTTQNLKIKLQNLCKDVEENQKQNKRLLKQLSEQNKSFQNRQKLDKNFRQIQSKFKELLIKIDKLQKREHPQDLELKIMKITSQHGQKLNSHQDKIKNLDIQLSSINNVMQSMGTGTGGGGDPHKLCQLDGQIRRLRDGNRTNEGKLHSLEDQLKTKLLIFEERIMTTLGMIKGQDHFVSREELYETISRLRQPLNERMNENNNLINQLHTKCNKLEMFEKSTKKKIRDMTKGDELNKILDLKMNSGEAESHFNAMNMKMEALQIIMNRIKMEMESNSDFLKMLQKELNEPEEGFNILGPKAKVFPAKCMGCGDKHIPAYDNNMMQGTDGKLYKVDMKNYTSDMRQVYGVTQSQIATFDSPMKKTMKTRPTSGKTNGRPSSSKYF